MVGFPPQGKFYRCTDEAKSSPEECKLVLLVAFLLSQLNTCSYPPKFSLNLCTTRPFLIGAPTSCIKMGM